ncbi:hypothetical protein BB029_12960 [Pseudomonas sp. S3E12]|nr:hypothetical protein [Pseudomonas sp. S3E12]OCW24023.1 hypothetical protein BB029_12960 [Pseudomonas sp. S3E12]
MTAPAGHTHFGTQARDQFIQHRAADIIAGADTQSDAPLGLFLLVDHQKKGHFLQGGFADLIADRLVAKIQADPQASAFDRGDHLTGLVILPFADGQQGSLLRRKLLREQAAVLLDTLVQRKRFDEPVQAMCCVVHTRMASS